MKTNNIIRFNDKGIPAPLCTIDRNTHHVKFSPAFFKLDKSARIMLLKKIIKNSEQRVFN